MLPSYDDGFERSLNRAVLEQMLPKLHPEAAAVIDGIFFRQVPQWQLGQELGVTQMQVSRILHKALSKLRPAFVGSAASSAPGADHAV